MSRLITHFLVLLLLVSTSVASAGKLEICFGDGHVELAPSEDHHSDGCCEDAPSCTDIVLSAVSDTAARSCGQVDVYEAAVARCIASPNPFLLSAGPVLRKRAQKAEHPPPLSLTIANITVLRL